MGIAGQSSHRGVDLHRRLAVESQVRGGEKAPRAESISKGPLTWTARKRKLNANPSSDSTFRAIGVGSTNRHQYSTPTAGAANGVR